MSQTNWLWFNHSIQSDCKCRQLIIKNPCQIEEKGSNCNLSNVINQGQGGGEILSEG